MANNTQPTNSPNDDLISRVHDLTWALVDGVISEEQMTELEGALLDNPVARDAYIRCVQLHADLTTEFQKPAKKGDKKTPILSFLADPTLSALNLPQVKDANS